MLALLIPLNRLVFKVLSIMIMPIFNPVYFHNFIPVHKSHIDNLPIKQMFQI